MSIYFDTHLQTEHPEDLVLRGVCCSHNFYCTFVIVRIMFAHDAIGGQCSPLYYSVVSVESVDLTFF